MRAREINCNPADTPEKTWFAYARKGTAALHPPLIADGRLPPIGRAAGLRVARNRCDHFTTLATLTLKVAATFRQLSPAATAATTRSRDQANRLGPSDAGLHSSQHLESKRADSRIPTRFRATRSRSKLTYRRRPAPHSRLARTPATKLRLIGGTTIIAQLAGVQAFASREPTEGC
jgi:hypothetical protein